MDEKQIDQLTENIALLLMHLTRLDKKPIKPGSEKLRVWKGYMQGTLSDLEEQGLIRESHRTEKVIYLTAKGIKRAEQLQEPVYECINNLTM